MQTDIYIVFAPTYRKNFFKGATVHPYYKIDYLCEQKER